MTNQTVAYGLQPVQRLDGAVWNDSLRTYYVPASYTNALFVGDPVIKKAGSADINGINGVDLAAAGDTNQITGVVCGFLGSCAAGAPNSGSGGYLGAVNMFASAGTPGNIYRPATTALDWYVLVNDDPEAQFYIQADAAVAVANVGKNANLLSGTGSVYTGWSGWQLNHTGINTTATFQLRIIGNVPDPTGVPNATGNKFIVQINTHTELPHQAGI
jgi:hypothetical protein